MALGGLGGNGGGGGGASLGTPAVTLSTSNAQGAATTAIATDATIAVFDATAPTTAAFGDAAAAGNAGTAARRNHSHGMPANPALFGKMPCAYATAAALPTNTYYNGANNDGVGATLTGTANGPLAAIDSVTITTLGTRILVRKEALGKKDGIYTLTQVGVVAVSPYILTRATDADTSAAWGPGVMVAVQAPSGSGGTLNDDSIWLSQSGIPFTIGTTSMLFSKVGYTGSLLAANNLSDLSDIATARTNIGLTDLVWTNVTGGVGFQNGWSDLGGYRAVAYAKDLFNVVHIRGAMTGGSGSGATAFTLPSGFRPAAQEFLTAGATGVLSADVEVATNGAVTVDGGPTAVGFNATFQGDGS